MLALDLLLTAVDNRRRAQTRCDVYETKRHTQKLQSLLYESQLVRQLHYHHSYFWRSRQKKKVEKKNCVLSRATAHRRRKLFHSTAASDVYVFVCVFVASVFAIVVFVCVRLMSGGVARHVNESDIHITLAHKMGWRAHCMFLRIYIFYFYFVRSDSTQQLLIQASSPSTASSFLRQPWPYFTLSQAATAVFRERERDTKVSFFSREIV